MGSKSSKFSTLVRVGYFSRAILYCVLGLIALTSAGRISQGTNGIFDAIEEFPLGHAIPVSYTHLTLPTKRIV